MKHAKTRACLLISSLLSSAVLYNTASYATPETAVTPRPQMGETPPPEAPAPAIAGVAPRTTEISPQPAPSTAPAEASPFPSWLPAAAELQPASAPAPAVLAAEIAPAPTGSDPPAATDSPAFQTSPPAQAQPADTGTAELPAAQINQQPAELGKLSLEPAPAPTAAQSALLLQIQKSAHSANSILPQPAPEIAQGIVFPDVRGHWAQSFIEALAARDIIRGFPDGTFRPDEPVTRAQFAAMVRKAFPRNPIRSAVEFVDVPSFYWGHTAIQEAYSIGFLEGYPNRVFQPDQNIPRGQVLVSLGNGLNLTAKADPRAILTASFQDAGQIASYAINSIAAATENRLVVNYPSVAFLNPNQIASRAEVAAFIYQALVSAGTAPALPASDIATQYIVGYQPPVAQQPQPPIPPRPQPTETAEVLRQRFRLREPATLQAPTVSAVSTPGSSSGSPTAFGASWGRGFLGAGFQERTRYTNDADGSISLGIGLGDAKKTVGVEVTAGVYSLFGDDSFQRGGISFKAHRLLPQNFAVAVGVENAIIWGSTDAGSSVYGVVSKIFQLRENPREPFSQLTASVGLGGGRFRSENDINNGEDSVNVFGSVGLRVAEPVSLIADWTGQDLTIGASIVPFRNVPLVITPAVADITDNAGDGARFILGVGYNFTFGR
ncbi:S-layer homology domain-containing protein [Kamptonema formosum]|uniref:S-layer homology domain-containing protein n=1 Tax=Kamptonema formosum TaxID=331992 RepID=UPI00034B9DF5|nr:S-layer homology domain-containing protein [Oscillatoria sp. PCC 10802]